MKKTPPRMALVGVSGYGRVYLRWLEAARQRGEIEFVAATVVNPEEERETCQRLAGMGVRIYTSWETMLEDLKGRLDLCMIPAPIHLHASIAVSALEGGANVLVEKPLAGSLAQAALIQDAERRTGRWIAVGFQDVYAPSTQAISRKLLEGRIGTIQKVRWLGLWPRTEDYYRRNNWAGRLSVDGLPVRDSPLNNAMAHFLNLSLLWAGSAPGCCAWPSRVTGELFRHHPIESFDTAFVQIRTDTAVDIRAAATHYCVKEHSIRVKIQGTEGELNWHHGREAVLTFPGGEELYPLEPSHEASVEYMFRAVLRKCVDPSTPVCTSAQAMPHVAAIEALHQRTAIQTVSEYSDPSAADVETVLKRSLRENRSPSRLGYGRPHDDSSKSLEEKAAHKLSSKP
ncbi:MAG: Gfo/Idh/MocA family protein [Candidatus Methylacidiphilales bacterium]|nr:Gfo/Idh/MocA family oxidoreductase [Candidatus Methylacidiphilales bacterium]